MSASEEKVEKVAESHELTFADARDVMRGFVKAREWEQFHTPRNLVMALVGEVGEVAEIFQWKGEVAEGLPTFSEEERRHVGDELADVLAYLVRLADVCHVDLAQAFTAKVQKNERKYPAELVKGSSKKYTEYRQNWT